MHAGKCRTECSRQTGSSVDAVGRTGEYWNSHHKAGEIDATNPAGFGRAQPHSTAICGRVAANVISGTRFATKPKDKIPIACIAPYCPLAAGGSYGDGRSMRDARGRVL